ncbi:MAG: precorrin-6y C5,15-methyltransferase (decarboxylating) subunit CbiE [Hyphomicrobiaceae bacterium]
MNRSPGPCWLSIIGIGEDGLAGLSLASRKALDAAEIVFGGPRHLALAAVGARGRSWPVPFDVTPVMAERGRAVAVLASGDPFWFGAGGSIVGHLPAGEWTTYPAPSTFSHAAARLGWRLEETHCCGLHAAPFERLVPVLSRGAKVLCLVRDGDAAAALCSWLTAQGWGKTAIIALSSLGGPNEALERATASQGVRDTTGALFIVGLEPEGRQGIPRSSGLPDGAFIHDGQITKQPVRALALSALEPRPGERLWDVGAGSGTISVEWALAGGVATAIEQHAARAANIRANAKAFGLAHKITIVEGIVPEALAILDVPDAVFVGGGLTARSFETIWSRLPAGTRFVAHAVSLETQGLLTDLHGRYAGDLHRFDISHAQPLGRMRSWQAARPIVQWSARK